MSKPFDALRLVAPSVFTRALVITASCLMTCTAYSAPNKKNKAPVASIKSVQGKKPSLTASPSPLPSSKPSSKASNKPTAKPSPSPSPKLSPSPSSSPSAVPAENAEKTIGDDSVPRLAEIRHLEFFSDRTIHAFVSVFELEGLIRYPVATLDRAAFQILVGGDQRAPTSLSSLWTFQSLAPPKQRALMISFQDVQEMPLRLGAEVRKAIAELLPTMRSDFLSVQASGGGKFRDLAAMTPRQADNIKALQRNITSSEPLGPDVGITQTICRARDQFAQWEEIGFESGDQKILIIVGSLVDPLVVSDEETNACWQGLTRRGVRTYMISYDPVAPLKRVVRFPVASSNGGFQHLMRSPLDVFPVLSNIASLLNDEYVLEFEVLPNAITSSLLPLEVQVSYHGNIFRSEKKSVIVPADLVPSRPSPEFAASKSGQIVRVTASEPRRWQDLVALIAFIVVVLSLCVYVVWRIRALRRTRLCNTCGLRVARNFRNCPFLRKDLIARLTVVSGPHVGRVYPLFEGRNSLGWGRRSTVVLRGFRSIRYRHGSIEIKSGRAVYLPKRARGNDLINGWPVFEPRLLGNGTVMRFGAFQARFDAKPVDARLTAGNSGR